MTDANAEAIEAWNTVLFDKFVRFKPLLTTGLAGHGDAVLARHPPAPGAHVLDLGCGFGDTTLQIARIVGREGKAVGVDAAARFVEGARKEAEEQGLGNAEFLVADVQSEPLGGPYDLAFSRMGTMFFASPLGAMRNVRRSLVPGGRLCMAVWRKREDNPWIHDAERAVREIVPEPEKHDQPTCGPGPFSMAGADTVSEILVHAGFTRVTLERHDIPILIGRDMDEALAFAMALGPAGEILRLAGEDGERHRPAVVRALRAALEPYATADGVRAPSSAWIVSAVAA